MRTGHGYYEAVNALQGQNNYPTRPFVTVREPTLAFLSAHLGSSVMTAGFIALVFVALLIAMVRFAHVSPSKGAWVGACLLCGVSTVPLLVKGVEFHEAWAGLLLFVAVMVHLLSRQHRRAMAWVVAGGVDILLLIAHGLAVVHLVAPAAQSSQGWLKLGGWPFFVETVWLSSPLYLGPTWFAAVIVSLALVGWLALRSRLALSASLVLLLYAITFCFVGRSENWYWGMMYTVLLIPGLAFVPRAAVDTWTSWRARGH